VGCEVEIYEKVVGLNLVSAKIVDENGIKAIPGLNPATNSGSIRK